MNKNFSSYGYGTIYGNRSLEGIVRLSCSTRFLTFTIESDNILMETKLIYIQLKMVQCHLKIML